MNILNDDGDRLFRAECSQQFRDHGPLSLIARGIGHRIIDGEFLLRLSKVKQVVEKDPAFGRQDSVGNGCIGRSLPGLFVAAAGNIEETLHHRADGVAALANAKIQHEPPVHLETIRRGDARKLFHQPSLADTGLATDDNGATAAALPAARDHADKLRQFSLAADEWHANHGSIRDAF